MSTILIETQEHKLLTEPYILKVSGWIEERYYKEAPDNQISEYVRGTFIMYSPASARHQEM
jgi:hypothetical protein